MRRRTTRMVMMMMMQRMMMMVMVMVMIPVNNCGSASVTVVGPNVQVPGVWVVNLGPRSFLLINLVMM